MNNPFLYDTHVHTIETSPCGKLYAADIVEWYASHGYTGLVITDHLHKQFLDTVGSGHDWDTVVEKYTAGYKAAVRKANEIGFTVILGAEMRFWDNDNDYLVYGIDEQWLRISSWGREYYINRKEYERYTKENSSFAFSNLIYLRRTP